MGWRWVDFLNVRRLSLQIVSGIEVVHLITPRERRSYDCVILLKTWRINLLHMLSKCTERRL